MRGTCEHVSHMPAMVQIRNVPDDVHEALKVRAAKLKLSMSDYVLAELRRALETPTPAEFLEKLAKGPKSAPLNPSAAAIIRENREVGDRKRPAR
ncbi:MAG: hypothetical protein IPK82_35520 [Polyangiaceae bacterium]|nr:hypothetical protein [Polyangiaceae bacterium]